MKIYVKCMMVSVILASLTTNARADVMEHVPPVVGAGVVGCFLIGGVSGVAVASLTRGEPSNRAMAAAYGSGCAAGAVLFGAGATIAAEGVVNDADLSKNEEAGNTED